MTKKLCKQYKNGEISLDDITEEYIQKKICIKIYHPWILLLELVGVKTKQFHDVSSKLC